MQGGNAAVESHHMTEDEMHRIRRVKLLSLDCDGVMTDGLLIYAADGTELRRFHVRDGVGIKAVLAAGIEVAFITASETIAIGHRARALGVKHCYLGADDKLARLEALCGELRISLEHVAHVGDDLNDIPILTCVGCPMTVADAVPEVLEIARVVSTLRGGHGAVRQLCDMILEAQAKSRGIGRN